AWLKAVTLLVKKQLRWSRTLGAIAVVNEALSVARDLHLSVRQRELEALHVELRSREGPS
ncbi:MAG: hypothetical protein L7S64_07200, partial [Longimicrobiales bacterium]|nr:hypothetical protein [Longimicrobiales bacterium]